jgi:hypothetical protein
MNATALPMRHHKTTTGPRRSSLYMGLAAVPTVALALITSVAHADVTPPCCDFDNVVTCTNVGSSCPSGGTCRSVQCGFAPTFLQKCVACPVPVEGPDAGDCSDTGQIFKPCGDGGICQLTPSQCRGPYIQCSGPLDWEGQAAPPPNCTYAGLAVDASLDSDAGLPGNASVGGEAGTQGDASVLGDGGLAVDAGLVSHASDASASPVSPSSTRAGGGAGCAIGPRDASNIVLAWLFATIVPLTFRRILRRTRRR